MKLPDRYYCTLDDTENVLWMSVDQFNLIETLSGEWEPPTAEAIEEIKGSWMPYFWAEMADGQTYPMFFYETDLTDYHAAYCQDMATETKPVDPLTMKELLHVYEIAVDLEDEPARNETKKTTGNYWLDKN